MEMSMRKTFLAYSEEEPHTYEDAPRDSFDVDVEGELEPEEEDDEELGDENTTEEEDDEEESTDDRPPL